MRWGTILRQPIIDKKLRIVKLPLQHPDMFAIVDLSDLELVSKFNWHASKRKHTIYVVTTLTTDGKQKHRYLHHVLTGTNGEVDHQDGDGLNNRRLNLRPCSNHGQNNANMRPKGRYKGIEKRSKGYWCAKTKANGKTVRIGRFTTQEDAARAYDAFMVGRFGDFARLNFPRKVPPL